MISKSSVLLWVVSAALFLPSGVLGQVSAPVTGRDSGTQSANAQPAAPERAEPPRPPPPDRPFSLSAATLSGDWGGLRTKLREQGVTFNWYVNNQYQAVVNGGKDTNGGRNSASTDAFLTLDLDKLRVIKNADFLLHFQSNWGAGVNARTGAVYEVNDDADGDLGGHVAQLWYRQHFFDRRLAIMGGFLDYQTIVDRNAFANSEDKQFWNQSLDNNPLVPLGIGLGISATYRPVDWYSLILGVGDAQSVLYKPGFSTAFHDEAWFFGYVEQDVTVKIPSARGPLSGNYRTGVVYDPRVRAVYPTGRWDARLDGNDYGFFVSVDQMILRENSKSEQGLGLFGRFGYRTPETNRIARFWSAGLSYLGLVPGRDDDVLGVGFSCSRGSTLYRERVNDAFDNETVYELYYAVQVAKWLVITPDLQYIDNPGANGSISHAVAAGVRARVSF